jgi:hypothetical protein
MLVKCNEVGKEKGVVDSKANGERSTKALCQKDSRVKLVEDKTSLQKVNKRKYQMNRPGDAACTFVMPDQVGRVKKKM